MRYVTIRSAMKFKSDSPFHVFCTYSTYCTDFGTVRARCFVAILAIYDQVGGPEEGRLVRVRIHEWIKMFDVESRTTTQPGA